MAVTVAVVGQKVKWRDQEGTVTRALDATGTLDVRLGNGTVVTVHRGTVSPAAPAVDTGLRQALDQIDAILAGPYGDKVSKVLRATRGPDVSNEALKTRTTGRIRQAAFPRGYGKIGYGEVGKVKASDFAVARAHNPHYAASVEAAAQALGIVE